jgi:hypothetical protein
VGSANADLLRAQREIEATEDCLDYPLMSYCPLNSPPAGGVTGVSAARLAQGHRERPKQVLAYSVGSANADLLRAQRRPQKDGLDYPLMSYCPLNSPPAWGVTGAA